MMFHGMKGLGDDGDGSDISLTPGTPVDQPISSVSVTTSPYDTTAVNNAVNNSNAINSGGVSIPSGNASTGFNWGGLLSSLIGTGGAVASNVLTSGNTTAQVQAQSAAQIAAAQASAASSSTFMTLGLIGGGVVLLMLLMKGKR